MPERFIEERFDKLGEAVAAASAQVEADRLERESTRRAEEERRDAENHRRWWARLAAGLLAAALLASLVSLKRTVDDIQEVRRESRRTLCTEFQRDRLALNRIMLGAVGFDRDTGEPGPDFNALPPDRLARVEEFLADLRPIPICRDDDLISAYYRSGGVEGVVQVDGSDGSYSEAVTVP